MEGPQKVREGREPFGLVRVRGSLIKKINQSVTQSSHDLALS